MSSVPLTATWAGNLQHQNTKLRARQATVPMTHMIHGQQNQTVRDAPIKSSIAVVRAILAYATEARKLLVGLSNQSAC
jgi:hypothetical protein